MKKMVVCGLLLAFLLIIVGCAKTEQVIQPSKTEIPAVPAVSVKELKIEITHGGGFEPDEFAVKKGDTVRFLATSHPVSHRHGIGIAEYGIDEEIIASPTDEPQAVEFVADKAGTFGIDCGTSCAQGPLGEHAWHKAVLVVVE